MDDSVQMISQRASVESERLALLEKANLSYFLKSIGIAALCWAVLFLYVLPVVAGKADGEKLTSSQKTVAVRSRDFWQI